MRLILILIAVAVVMFLAREQLGALMPANSGEASKGQSKQGEYVQYKSKTPEQCAEELGADSDEQALLRCTTGEYNINMHGIR